MHNFGVNFVTLEPNVGLFISKVGKNENCHLKLGAMSIVN